MAPFREVAMTWALVRPMDLRGTVSSGMRGGRAQAIRWLAFLLFGLAVACENNGKIQDPLGLSATPTRDGVDLADGAARQLELEAAAQEIQARFSKLHESGGWRERGYFTPSEHDAIEWLLFRLLHNHRVFWGEIDRLGGAELAFTAKSERPGSHLLALHAGLALADSSTFLVTEFREDPIAIAKLNEAFYRTEIPADSYDLLRLAVTSPERHEALAEAWALHEQELGAPDGSPVAEAARDLALAPILSSLSPLWARVEKRLRSLASEHGRIVADLDHSRAADAARASGEHFELFGYQTRALIFKDSSRIKSPSAHLITFSEAQKREIHRLLRPGDVVLTYTAGYVSDVFIPGTFKHGITYVGVGEERAAAGLTAASAPTLDRSRADRFATDVARNRMPDGSRADLIEAVAEGVKFSNLDRILDTHVNRLLVLRPQIDDVERTAFLAGVIAFVGDPYDFRFDFADASRQVCTEVIYRALNGKGGIDFALTSRAGHPTLSADDVVLYHFATPGHFEVMLYAEEDPEGSDHAARLWTHGAAEKPLKHRMAASQVPVVGMRTFVDLTKHWNLEFIGDYGGWGVDDNHQTWKGAAYLGYRWPGWGVHWNLQVGYRAIRLFEMRQAATDISLDARGANSTFGVEF